MPWTIKKKKKKKLKKKPEHHPEAKGLLFIGAAFILFLSFFSFIDAHHELNWLGLVGHVIAYGFHYIFGLASYAIALFLGWMGWRLLRIRSYNGVFVKTFYLFFCISSLCILLNLLAETKWFDLSMFYDRVYSETAILYTPTPVRYVRYNLGGVPFYYLFRDLPHANLQLLLSNVGVLILSSITFLFSLILLTDVSFSQGVRRVMRIFPFCYDCTVGLLRKVLSLSRLGFPRKSNLPLKASSSISPKIKRNSYRHSPPYQSGLQQSNSAQAGSGSEQNQFNSSAPLPSSRRRNHTSPFEDLQSDAEDAVVEEIDTLQITMKDTARNKMVIEDFIENRQLKKSRKPGRYSPPPPSLLTDARKVDQSGLKKELKRRAEILEETLYSFGIEAKVGHIYSGPTITSFEVHPAIGVKVQKIKALENDIALNLQAKSIRIIAPIPGKAAVGVEIPSLYPQEVGFKEMLSTYRRSDSKFHIPMLLGKTVSGEEVMCDLTKMPHCIIAGATGSGKSVCINTIIMSIIMNLSHEEVKLILIDPKKVELTFFSKLPHLIAPVITEPSGAYAALQWIVKEMQYRYEVLKRIGVRNISAFNKRKIDSVFEESLDCEVPEKFHFIVCIIDEFADLMMTSSADLETPIARIAQMARAVGIHLILATQRPSREVITGLIKANFPTRISFKVSSRINSQIILDENGAESLLGNGDMLFLPPGTSQLIRCQGVFIRDEDINKIVQNITDSNPPNYLFKSFDNMEPEDMGLSDSDSSARDPLYSKALDTVYNHKTASTTFLQRKLKIGYARAASLMDELEDNGIIGPQDGSRPRQILKDR